jgi:hypothetical protein
MGTERFASMAYDTWKLDCGILIADIIQDIRYLEIKMTKKNFYLIYKTRFTKQVHSTKMSQSIIIATDSSMVI